MGRIEKIILPTGYFPPVSYFAYILHSHSVFIEQMETFPRQTYRNRCEILTSSGKLNLIVPVSKPNGNHTLTRDIEICYREPWQQHHWKSIQTAYRSSPFFNYYADIILPLFTNKESSLIALNNNISRILGIITGINAEFHFTEDYVKSPGEMLDLRSAFSPHKKQFKFQFREYPQVFGHRSGFTGDLSILDVIFNLGPETKDYLMEAVVI
ncbi:MAG: WbqC family protein [Bacteroidales bacterium]|jgi:hypothetical protein|nr:WbqC family protein [Bacteroidales bacterium]